MMMGIPESEAIPYEANHLRGERLLVLAPHPDDEAIGCGGLVALHLREHREVRVIVATDGAQGGEARIRESESREGLSILGGGAAVEFLRYPDRQLDRDRASLQQALHDQIDEFKPDLIAAPSPIEIHPDHLALSRALWELVQRDETLFADHAVTRIAFYEVGAPIRPNALVDISSVADLKSRAIAAHHSQHTVRDYRSYAEGLNAYRSMTLPAAVKFAEAYWLTPLPALRTMSFSALRDAVGAPKPIEITETVPISVVIRTKDRLPRLAEAIESVRKTGYPAEIVVVNDGGAKPQVEGALVINHESSRGRSEAMNAGVRAAKSPFIAFLDDDDLYYPEHLATLAAATSDSPHVAWYTDAVSAFVRNGTTTGKMRIFANDFDRDELLLDNYIPTVALLVHRQQFLDLGGFDPKFDLFEDWDFLIRLSQRGTFAHIPAITCEIRHIEGEGSITLDSPEGSARFREAKLQIWKKHAALIDNDVIANVLERQKRRQMQITHDTVEVRGERDALQMELVRLEREKGQIIAEIGALQGRAAHLDGANAELRNALSAADSDRYEKNVRLQDLKAAYDDLTSANEEANRTGAALYAEVGRLQSLLDMIYESRTWKLHSMVEKMKGRG